MAAMAAILDFPSKQFLYFYLQVTPMLPTKFQVYWPFVSGEEEKKVKMVAMAAILACESVQF